jgi:hypothetical protein
MRTPAQHPLMPWLVELAAVVLNRYEVGKGGKTAYERGKGKPAKTFGLGFAEAEPWKRKPSGDHLGKLTCLWEDVVFLGIKGCTGEIIVANGKRVWKMRTVHRRPARTTGTRRASRWRRACRGGPAATTSRPTWRNGAGR